MRKPLVPVFFSQCRGMVALALMCFMHSSAADEAGSVRVQLQQHINEEIRHFSALIGLQVTEQEIELFIPRGIEQLGDCEALHVSRRQESTPPWGRSNCSLECSSPGQWQGRASARIKVWTDLVVAQRTLERDEVLTEDLLTMTNMEVSQVRHGLEFDPAELSGLKTRRRIAAGQPVGRHLLISPSLVNSGSHVTLSISLPGFSASAQGVAMENGQLGERVRIRNMSSGKIVEGVVTGENQVEIH